VPLVETLMGNMTLRQSPLSGDVELARQLFLEDFKDQSSRYDAYIVEEPSLLKSGFDTRLAVIKWE